MTTSTFQSDPHVETNDMDGESSRFAGGGDLWTTGRDAAGTASTDSATTFRSTVRADANTDEFDFWARSVLKFDTSALPDGDTISAAKLEAKAVSKSSALTGPTGIQICAGTSASDTAMASTDHVNNKGNAAWGDLLAFGDITTGTGSYGALWNLDATGIAGISKTGVTGIGLQLDADQADNEPTWGSGQASGATWHSADNAGGASDAPILTVTHATAGGSPWNYYAQL